MDREEGLVMVDEWRWVMRKNQEDGVGLATGLYRSKVVVRGAVLGSREGGRRRENAVKYRVRNGG